MSQRRSRIKHIASFEDRLAGEAYRLKEQADTLPAGKERDDLLREARQAETAFHVSAWLSSPGLAAPT